MNNEEYEAMIAEIAEYISTKNLKTETEKNRYRTQITLAVNLLAEMEIKYPDEAKSFYTELDKKFESVLKQNSPDTRRKSKNRVKGFFEYICTKETQITMPEEINNVHDIHDMGNAQSEYLAQQATNESEAQSEHLITGQTTDIQQPAPSQVATTEKAKSAPEKRSVGRPKRTDGIENRSKRFALQLQPALCEKLNILAKYDECSATEILTRILEQYINTRIDDINYMVRMNEELKTRKAKQN